jgi:hypothetical protein
MEIVLALAAIVGISLIAVPRLRRRKRVRVRPNAGKQWTTTAAARRNRRPAHARNGWSTSRTAAATAGAGTASAVATDAYDEWDDDLDWGGVTAPPAAPPPQSDLDWQLPNGNGHSNGAVTEPTRRRCGTTGPTPRSRSTATARRPPRTTWQRG